MYNCGQIVARNVEKHIPFLTNIYNVEEIVARNVEKHIPFLTNIYNVEGPRGPEQFH